MLQCHITTDDLLRFDNALRMQDFRTPSGDVKPYVHGIDGALVNTSGAYVLTAATQTFDSTYIGETVNFPNYGMLTIVSLVSGDATKVNCVMDGQLANIIEYYNNSYEIADATDLTYSIGGLEDKIKYAYRTLLIELQNKGVDYTAIADDDNIYIDCIRAKALEIAHEALIRDSSDVHALKSNKYMHDYENLKTALIPRKSGISTTVATRTWSRSS